MEIKTLAKNTVILASPKVLKFFTGILKAKIIAVFLGVAGAGIIDQLQYIINQIKFFALASLPDGMVKIIAQQNGEEFDVGKISSIIKTYIYIVIPITILMTGLGYYFSDEITLYIFGDIKFKRYFQIGFISFPITILSTTSRALLKAFKEIKSIALAETFILIINLLIFIPLVYFFKITGGVIYVTLSFITTFVVVFSLTRKNVFKKFHIGIKDLIAASFKKKYFKELLNYMGAGIIGGTYLIFTEVTSRSIVVNQLGIEQLGIYAPITRWSNLFIGFILPSIFTYLYPRLSESKNNDEIISLVNSVIRLTTFVAMPFIIIGISIRQWIIPLFYSVDFIDATLYLPYHFSTLILFIWGSILSQLFYATGRLKSYLIFGLIINSISLLSVYYLVPNIGMYGYMVKFLISHILTSLIFYLYWRKEIKFKLDKNNLPIMLYSIITVALLLVLKDVEIYLQITAILLLIIMIFMLTEKEKTFLRGKLEKILGRKNR